MVRFGRKEEKEGEKIKEQREQQGLGKGGEEGGWGGWGGRTIIRSVAGERRGKSAVQFRGRQWPSLLFFFFLCQGRTDGTVFGLSFSPPPPLFFSRQSSPPDFPMIRKCCCHWLRRGGKRGGRGFARPTSVSRLQVKKSRGTESGVESLSVIPPGNWRRLAPAPASARPRRGDTRKENNRSFGFFCSVYSLSYFFFLSYCTFVPPILLSPDRRVFFLPRSREAKHGKNGQGRDRIQSHRQLRWRICLPFSCNTVCIKTDPRYFCNEIDKLA